MNRRTGLKLIGFALAFMAMGGVHAAQPEVQPLSPTQAGGSNGQIEVVEFFSYGCPHCYNLDPLIRKWDAAQKKDVVLKRVPVSFGRPAWAALGRIYTTLDAMKLADKYGPLVFEAVQKSQVRLEDEKTRNEWLAKNGIDAKLFNDTWNSFGVDSLSKRYEQMSIAYKITAVPTLAVDGKFKVIGEDEDTLRAVDGLIGKLRTGGK